MGSCGARRWIHRAVRKIARPSVDRPATEDARASRVVRRRPPRRRAAQAGSAQDAGQDREEASQRRGQATQEAGEVKRRRRLLGERRGCGIGRAATPSPRQERRSPSRCRSRSAGKRGAGVLFHGNGGTRSTGRAPPSSNGCDAFDPSNAMFCTLGQPSLPPRPALRPRRSVLSSVECSASPPVLQPQEPG